MNTRIFLIDDDDIFNFVHRRIIERELKEVSVTVYNVARKALEHLIAQAENQQDLPKFIFLDLNMPDLNGFDFLQALMDAPFEALRQIRIVIVTSSLHDQDVAKAFTFPMVKEFLDKPLEMETIMAILKAE
jgi:CheY-like chemotaxis protein